MGSFNHRGMRVDRYMLQTPILGEIVLRGLYVAIVQPKPRIDSGNQFNMHTPLIFFPFIVSLTVNIPLLLNTGSLPKDTVYTQILVQVLF